jgi:hypothetical protein
LALVVGGCLQQPVGSLSGAVKETPAWDDSTAFEAGDRQLVMTGPVLQRAVDSAPEALQVVSRSVLEQWGSKPRQFDCESAPASYQRMCHDPLARETALRSRGRCLETRGSTR